MEIHKHLSKDTEIRDMNIIMLTFCSFWVTSRTGDLRRHSFLSSLVVGAAKRFESQLNGNLISASSYVIVWH